MTAPALRRRSVGPDLASIRASRIETAANGFSSNPFLGIEYSPAFIAFSAYTIAIITYRFPVGTAAMSTALLTLPMEKHPLRFPAVSVLAFALVGWALLGLTITQFPVTVLDEVSEFAKVCGVIFVAANVIDSRSRFRAFAVGSIILWGLFPLRGTMFGYFLYHGNEGGRAAWNYIYSNPNDLAGLCLLQLSMAIGLVVTERRPWVRLGCKFAVGVLVLVIVLTQSRGAIIALAAFGMIGGRKYFRNPKTIFSLVALAAVVFLVTPDTAWKRFSTIKDATNTDPSLVDPETVDVTTRSDQNSSQQRLAIWHVASAIIAENPVAGVGLGAYPLAHQLMARRPGFDWLAGGRRDTHSTYLNVLAETGVVGFILFASMIVLTIRTSRKARKTMQQRAPALSTQLFNMEVGLYGFLVAGIWGSYGYFIALYLHMVLMHAAAKLLMDEGGPPPMRGTRRVYPAPTVLSRSAGASA